VGEALGKEMRAHWLGAARRGARKGAEVLVLVVWPNARSSLDDGRELPSTQRQRCDDERPYALC
jgi:hypothetical protein